MDSTVIVASPSPTRTSVVQVESHHVDRRAARASVKDLHRKSAAAAVDARLALSTARQLRDPQTAEATAARSDAYVEWARLASEQSEFGHCHRLWTLVSRYARGFSFASTEKVHLEGTRLKNFAYDLGHALAEVGCEALALNPAARNQGRSRRTTEEYKRLQAQFEAWVLGGAGQYNPPLPHDAVFVQRTA
jgi:hypothetical protein